MKAWGPGMRVAEAAMNRELIRVKREIGASFLSNYDRVYNVEGDLLWERPKRPSLLKRVWERLFGVKPSPFRQP